MAEAGCKLTCSSGSQGKQPGLGPTVRALVVEGHLLIYTTVTAQSHHGHTVVDTSDGG